MATANLSLLAALEKDFQQIEEMDPSLVGGFRVIYDREVPFELRAANANQEANVGALEGVKVKVLVKGEENSITSLRVELSSESDLYFHHTCVINSAGFNQLREDQKLMCDFREFGTTVLKMFNRCIREPQSYLLVLMMQRDGNATLEFIQNLEYKFVDLLVLPFRESAEVEVRQQITYRYNAIRSRLALMTAKLQDVTALVKVKSPQLLSQIEGQH